MKRGPGPSRSSGLRRTTRLAPSRKPIRAKKRKPSEYARIYGSRQRVAWVKRQPCVVSEPIPFVKCDGPIENAHIVTGGMGRKSDADQIVPLCRYHHDAFHEHGVQAFSRYYGLDLAACASETERRWREAR